MENILTIARGINVMGLQLQLKRQPQLWGQRTDRTAHDNSPHREASDIWARYTRTLDDSDREIVWLPPSDLLPDVKNHARSILNLVHGDALGGVLLTRIPPGCRVHPHSDRGWHAEGYEKFALQVASHQQQSFCYADGEHITAPGDLFWFHNQAEHWVINDSPVERITMIVCVKLDTPFRGGV